MKETIHPFTRLTVEWKGPRGEALSVWGRSMRCWWWRWRTGRKNKETRMRTRRPRCCSGRRHWKRPRPRCLGIAPDTVSWRGSVFHLIFSRGKSLPQHVCILISRAHLAAWLWCISLQRLRCFQSFLISDWEKQPAHKYSNVSPKIFLHNGGK